METQQKTSVVQKWQEEKKDRWTEGEEKKRERREIEYIYIEAEKWQRQAGECGKWLA